MNKLLLLSASLHQDIGLKRLNLVRQLLNQNSDVSLYEIFQKIDDNSKNRFKNYSIESVMSAVSSAEKIITTSINNNIKIITTMINYPIVYAKGNISLLNAKTKVGIVGTRKPFDYVADLTTLVAEEISSLNIPIVSGLATGSDTQAHRGALAEKGSTIAVLPSGILSIYPYENIKLADTIAERGLLVSLFPPDFAIQKYSAILRNSLLADLSNVLILSQSSLTGGSCHAVTRFIEHKKPLYSFPFYGTHCELNEKIANTMSLPEFQNELFF